MLYTFKKKIKKFLPENYLLLIHKIRAVFASIIYGFPSRKIKVIAVAGTKGKTTTTNMISHILEKNGHKVAMISTANFQIGDRKWLNDVKLTTPSAFYVQKFLKKAVKEKCEYAILEASSHGMIQNRYWGIAFRDVIVTNLTSDHLDYHKTFENYKKSHYPLLGTNTKNLIINYDDPNTHELLDLPGEFKKIIFTLKDQEKKGNIRVAKADNVELKEELSSFDLVFDSEVFKVKLPLIGKFNIYNAIGAILVCYCEDVPISEAVKNLGLIENIPGRLEKIDEGQNFEVIVDYAHSPESLENVYGTLRPRAKKRMIAVLGGTGDRDKTYRSKGGELADKFADVVIVTNEDPYSENVEDIMDQVVSGIKNKKDGENFFRISDRRDAIKKAFEIAEVGDLVVITGKGCEQFMIFGDKKVPWDDRKVAREVLRDEI